MRILFTFLLLGLASSGLATTYTVTTTANSGPGSLRQAMLDANSTPGPDSIRFEISGTAPHTISPTSTLPTLSDAGTVIDGGSQNPNGYSGPGPYVIVDGSNMSSGYLFTLSAAQCELLGLYIRNAPYGGVSITSSGSSFRLGRAGNGCVISNHGYYGVKVDGASNGFIQGCFIGTDPTGTLDEGNSYHGLLLEGGANDNLIGGDASGEGNVISGNEYYGIEIECSSGNLIYGNYVGTDPNKTSPIPNEYSGISITFGGFFNASCTAQDNVVGGILPGQGNVIAHNLYYGVNIAGQNVTQNPMRGNEIYCNNYDGLSLSDGNYGQPNGNLGLATPTISTATTAGANGTAPPHTTVDLYADDGCSNCEPRTYLGSVNANSTGQWTYAGTLFGSVTAIATDANGNSSENSSCVFVSAGAPPSANFTASSVSLCAGQCINFTDQSSGVPTAYAWTFVGANTSSASTSSPTGICYDTPGSYDVSLIVTNTLGSDTLTLSNHITVSPAPIVQVGPDQSMCAGDSVSVALAGGLTYSWNPSADVSDLGGGTYAVFPSSSTLYVITGSDANGCTASDSLTLTVSANPTVNLGADLSLCQGESTLATPLSQPGVSLNWTPAAFVSDLGGGDFSLTPDSTTVFVVTATNADNCSGSDSLLVEVQPAPNLTMGSSPTICAGDSMALSASGADQYLWQPGGFSSANPVVSPDSSQTYVVVGTDGNGCTATDSQTVQVAPPLAPPSITQSGDTLFAGPGSYVNYQWYINGSPIIGANNSFLVANTQGNYSVEVSNERECAVQSESFNLSTHLHGGTTVHLRLFPNPGSQGFTLASSTTLRSLSIYDSRGRLLQQQVLGQPSLRVDMSHYPAGLYLLRVASEQGRATLRWQKR